MFPKPAQKPHPPVFLGGNARNVFRRIVAYGDGWMPVRVSPEDVEAARATLDELAESAGRDPKSIQICVYGVSDRDTIRRMEDAGGEHGHRRAGQRGRRRGPVGRGPAGGGGAGVIERPSTKVPVLSLDSKQAEGSAILNISSMT